MNLASAREILLARSFDTAEGPARLLSAREWADCTRAGLGAPGAAASFEAFVSARAAAACGLLTRREPALACLPAADASLVGAQALAMGLGLLVGLGTNLFNGNDRFNLFAPGVLAVLLWNLTFYGLLLGQAWPRRSSAPPQLPGVIQRLADWLGDRAQRQGTPATPSDPGRAAVLLAFLRDWRQAARPVLRARVVASLHLAGAALALGLVIGMYGRGLVAEYRVIWGSTFVGATQAHAWLSGVLGPASLLTGIPVPDPATLDALRHDAQVSPATASAAPWIHLYAATLGLVVVVPRAVLGLLGFARAARLGRNFPLPLNDAYFKALAQLHAASSAGTMPPLAARIALDVLVFPWPLSPASAAGLQALLTAAAGDAVAMTLRAPGPADENPTAPAPDATHRLVICDLASTPEPDTHGPLLRADGRLPLALLIDESRFRERFDEGSSRLTERRASWLRFAAAAGVRVLMLSLASPAVPAQAAAFRSLLGLSEGARE